MLKLEEDRILSPNEDFFETIQSLGKTQFDADRFMKMFLLEQGDEEAEADARALLLTQKSCLPTYLPTFPTAQLLSSRLFRVAQLKPDYTKVHNKVHMQQPGADKEYSLQDALMQMSSTRATKIYQLLPHERPDFNSTLMHSQLGTLQA